MVRLQKFPTRQDAERSLPYGLKAVRQRKCRPRKDGIEARENVLDFLRTVLTPDEELVGDVLNLDREHLRFTAAA